MAQRAVAAIEVTDFPAGLRFFTDQLQFAVLDHQPDQDVATIEVNGAPVLLVGPRARDIEIHLTASLAHFKPSATLSLLASDLETHRASFEERGLTPRPIVTEPQGDRVLRVTGPDNYTVALIEPAQRSPQETLALYVGAPDEMERALAGLAEADLDLTPEEGGWTIRQIVHHIVDGDDMWAMVLKAALGKSGCDFRLDWYSTDNAWAETLDYTDRPIAPAVALFRATRLHTKQLIEHLPDAWERYVLFSRGTEEEPQKIAVGEIVNIQARHALAHIREIQLTRDLHGR